MGTYAENVVSGYPTSPFVYKASGNALRITTGAFLTVIFSRITRTALVYIGNFI